LNAARFVPIAETAGLIARLTDHLLGKACRDAVGWGADVTLSFNISPAQLKDRAFGRRVAQILADTGLPPGRLELEIPESAMVADLDGAQQVLGAIRETGVRIALKDFGTGYSSLYHLRNFKLDRIKLDRSLIQGMTDNPQAAAIVRAMVGLGSGLGFTVAAEGVQDAQQQRMLAANGCEQIEGVSAALSAKDALALR
jgi:EAL domain-containing protein (putative c-di-GMP-specific phosphodiesterase class I)